MFCSLLSYSPSFSYFLLQFSVFQTNFTCQEITTLSLHPFRIILKRPPPDEGVSRTKDQPTSFEIPPPFEINSGQQISGYAFAYPWILTSIALRLRMTVTVAMAINDSTSMSMPHSESVGTGSAVSLASLNIQPSLSPAPNE